MRSMKRSTQHAAAGKKIARGEQRCLTHDLWEDLSTQIRDFLSDVSLDQLVKRESVQTIHRLQDTQVNELHTGPAH